MIYLTLSCSKMNSAVDTVNACRRMICTLIWMVELNTVWQFIFRLIVNNFEVFWHTNVQNDQNPPNKIWIFKMNVFFFCSLSSQHVKLAFFLFFTLKFFICLFVIDFSTTQKISMKKIVPFELSFFFKHEWYWSEWGKNGLLWFHFVHLWNDCIIEFAILSKKIPISIGHECSKVSNDDQQTFCAGDYHIHSLENCTNDQLKKQNCKFLN